MNTKLIIFNVTTLLALAAVLLHGQGAGPLDPPTGPADGVYRTLEEIYLRAQAAETQAAVATARAEAAESEAQAAKSSAQSASSAASAAYQNTQFLLPVAESRIPIGDLPFTISNPGSYYFRSNKHFTSPTGHAITITSSDVTLDLNGFTLSSSAGVTGDAIRLSNAVDNTKIRNGNIRGSSTLASPGGFENGIGTVDIASNVFGWQFRDLSVSYCRGNGIGFGSEGSRPFLYGTVTHCILSWNHGDGLRVAGSSVSNCHAFNNGRNGMSGGNQYHLCSSRQNAGAGFLSTSDGIVHSCSASSNGGSGIEGGVVIGSTARFNAAVGIFSNVATQSIMQANETGYDSAGSGGTLSFSHLLANGTDIGLGNHTRTGNYPAP